MGIKLTKQTDPCPCTPIHGILLVFNGSRYDFGVEVIPEVAWQHRFNGQGFGEELGEELFPGLLEHEHASTTRVDRRPARSAHHLQNLSDSIIHVSMLPSVVGLYTHHDHQVSSDGETPSGVLDKDMASSQYDDLRSASQVLLALETTRILIASAFIKLATMRLSCLVMASW